MLNKKVTPTTDLKMAGEANFSGNTFNKIKHSESGMKKGSQMTRMGLDKTKDMQSSYRCQNFIRDTAKEDLHDYYYVCVVSVFVTVSWI